MRSWKPRLLVVLAAGGVLALAVDGSALWGAGDALLLILLVATLVITYLLRRYARSELIYSRSTHRRLPVEPSNDRRPAPSPARREAADSRSGASMR